MSRFWQQPRRVAFNEDYHTRFNPSSRLNLPELTIILHRALENDASDLVLRRVLTDVCGLDLSSLTTLQLAELRSIVLAPVEPSKVTVRNVQDLPMVVAVRKWATERGIKIEATADEINLNDGESPDGFTLHANREENSNRAIGENEEPELTEDEVVTDEVEVEDE